MKIRKFREAAGLTMKELAGKVGVSVATVSRWESGEDLPAADTQLSDVFSSG